MHDPLADQKPHDHKRNPEMTISFIFNMKDYEGDEFQTAVLAKFLAEQVDAFFNDSMDYSVEIVD